MLQLFTSNLSLIFASLFFPKLMNPSPFLWRGTMNQYLCINSRSLETQRKFPAVGGHGSMSVKVFLAICCSFFCSVAVSVRADLPEYCGPQNYAYTPLRKDPRGEFTLKQVHVVIRFVASDVQNNMCYVNFYCC